MSIYTDKHMDKIDQMYRQKKYDIRTQTLVADKQCATYIDYHMTEFKKKLRVHQFHILPIMYIVLDRTYKTKISSTSGEEEYFETIDIEKFYNCVSAISLALDDNFSVKVIHKETSAVLLVKLGTSSGCSSPRKK